MIMSLHDPLSRKRSLAESNSTGNHEGAPGSNINPDQGSLNKRRKEDDFNDKMYTMFIKTALDSLEKNNDSMQLDSLTTKISLPSTNEEAIQMSQFKIILKFLMSNVTKLDNDTCNHLIMAVIDYKWLEVRNQDFIDIYSQFLLVLISSIPKYLYKVINKLVSEFQYLEAQNPHSQNHHRILKSIIKFNPTFLNKFPAIFQSNFPHHIAADYTILNNYIHHMLETLKYCDELQYDVWLLIVECCIKLDVELQNDLDDLDDEEIDDLINGEEEGSDEDSESDSDSDSEADSEIESVDSDDEAEDRIARQKNQDEDDKEEEEGEEGQTEYLLNPMTTPKDIKALVNKLDTIMNLLLQSTKESFSNDNLTSGSGVYLFNTITSLFKSHILPTHFTKSIQFLLFHVSQYQLELIDSYLVLLIDISFNPQQILEKRLKAMQYLSSYIARAKNLSKNQIVFVVSYLIGWLNKYIEEREFEINYKPTPGSGSDNNTGGMERFKLFYSTFQALLYIFCFRYKTLQMDEEGDWECDIDKFFQRVIITKFNPLKFIDETVCFIFANIATKLNVCYCYSIIEHNKRERILNTNDSKNGSKNSKFDGNSSMPSGVGNFKQKQEFLDLEGYFPFDPLVLPLSKKAIKENYIEWSDVNPNQDEEDEESASGSNQHTSSEDEDQSSSSDEDNSDSDSEEEDA